MAYTKYTVISLLKGIIASVVFRK